MTNGLVDKGQREVGESFVVGPLAFGCWRFAGTAPALAQELVETAADCGMTLLDTADIYGTQADGASFGAAETLLGDVFDRSPGLRDRFVLATKAGIVPGVPYDSSAPYLRAACEASLRRMGVDVIDVFQIHRPDPFTHPGEVADALIVLKEEGKIREVGVSNHTPSQLAALQAHLPLELATIQPEFSAVCLDPVFDGTFDQALELGLTSFAWSPLGGGRLATGDGVPPALLAVLDRLAARESVERTDIALAFVLAHPASPVAIVGTGRPERLRGATRALGVHLDRRDVYAIVEASLGRRMP